MALEDKWSSKLISKNTTPHISRKMTMKITFCCFIRICILP